MLDMPKRDLEWHKNDIAEEIQELKEANGLICRWSEVSDVVYAYTRTKWTGHQIERPISLGLFYVGAIYMFPKYILRWTFYYSIGKKFDKNLKITEVRNPKKEEKLHKIAVKWNLDPELFKTEVKRKMKYWVFLK
jgi:hypothetical protein